MPWPTLFEIFQKVMKTNYFSPPIMVENKLPSNKPTYFTPKLNFFFIYFFDKSVKIDKSISLIFL